MSLEEKESDDARIDYIGNITNAILEIDPGLWAEMMWNEDNQLIVKDFLDTPNTRMLFIYLNSKNKLTVVIEFPQQKPLSRKFMYFLKYEDIAIPMTNFRIHLMHGSLSNHPLKQFQAIYQQVMTPILCNPNNNTKWPSDVVSDIILHIEDFRKTLYYCVGQADGMTVLPVPETAKQVDILDITNINFESVGDSNIRSIVDSIGDMVMDWNLLINETLGIGSSNDPYIDAGDQDPLTEVIYWKDRKENFMFIYSQLHDPLVMKMALLLEKVDSCYNNAFIKMLRHVVEALSEAEDVANNLENLIEPFQNLDNCQFSEMTELIPELMETVTISWSSSKYFRCIPSRIGVLIIKMCNQLIKKSREFLNGSELFHKEREESKDGIEKVKTVLNSFIDAYYKCRDNMESIFEHAKLYPWLFPDSRVFSRLDNFLQRLDDIQKLFEAADTYKKIPTFTILGLQHTELKDRLDKIFENFCEQYKVFEESKYNILDLNNEAFEQHYSEFETKIDDLDRQLGASISQGCVRSSPTQQAFELMEMFSDVLKRPLVEVEFKKCVPNLINNIRLELTLAKQMYDDNMKCLNEDGYCIIYRNLHSVAGGLLWVSELKEKLTKLMESLNSIEYYFITPKDADLENQMYNELMTSLTKYSKNIFGKWDDEVENSVSTLIQLPVLVEGNEEQVFVNYDLRMSKIMDEVKILLKMQQPGIPESAVKMYNKYEILRYAQSLLTTTTNWYNMLCKELVPFEKSLISAQWEKINQYLHRGKKLTWDSSELQDFATEIFNFTKVVYEDINKTKENIREVQEMIDGWKQRPMYLRESPNAFVDLKIYMTLRVKRQYDDIKKTALKLQEKMEENLQLFQCDPDTQEWKDYLKYLESIIEDGLKNAAIVSLQYLFDNTDSANVKLPPFTKVKLLLYKDEGLSFDPPMIGKQAGSLLQCFEEAMDKIYEMGDQITRMTDDQETYKKTLKETEKLTSLKSGIIQHLYQGIGNANDAITIFKKYEDLWYSDVECSLDYFLQYGPIQENDEDEDEEVQEGEIIVAAEGPLELKPPTEEEFREEIASIEFLCREADEMQSIITVEPWLIIDITPFKEELLILFRQWIAAYKQSLIEQKNLGKLRKIEKEEVD